MLISYLYFFGEMYSNLLLIFKNWAVSFALSF